MRIFAKTARKVIGLLDEIHIKPTVAPKTPKFSVPLAPAPKPSGMGISVERTLGEARVAPEIAHPIEVPHQQPRPFLTQTAQKPYNILDNPHLFTTPKEKEYLNKLIAISKTNPEEYQKMLNSGLFDLVAQGKLPKTIFANLRENLFFTENFLKDVSKVHSGVPLVTEIPQGTNLKDIGKFVERGEVGVLNGKLYANQRGKAVELNLSKEKFEELFPLMERFKMSQGYIGDCWLISAMDNLISNPEQRVNLYKLFSQEGGDILIRYPHGKNALRFVNGEVYENSAFIESGAKGLRMLEQSFIFHRAKTYTKGAEFTDVLARLREKPDLIYKLESGVQGEFTDAVEGLDNVRSAKVWKDFFTVEIYRPIKFRLKTLGQKHDTHTNLKRWKEEKSTDIMVYNCEKGEYIHGREGLVSYDYDLHAPHGYSVQDYSIADRIVRITNPHHTEVHINAPLNVLEDYGHFTRFNRV